ncbi:rhomboid family intramembrane serine protease [Fulvivirga maritima]|uniref:rhomboid family intramembrane serine protease n=1 Tax=Fulvivirga maritima TaxID=2904247 RepID=UPI001F2D8C16|nr:rhomboid family intramembrane serine protease [Fulvivirga maritima]UII25243.1 rhomboid family intramembrane serine protease [Fulvivirga maritima]
MAGERTLIGSAVVPIRFVFFMWLAFTVEFMLGFPLSNYGIQPRTMVGLIGIISAPLLHGGIVHILSNTFPMLFLGMILFYSYHGIANKVFLRCYFFTNVLVWIFARPANHIGASGVVYGLASFLIFYGFFRKDFKSLFISLIVLVLYGSIFYGVLPVNTYISWESHLAGAVVGFFTARQYKNVRV